MNRLSPELKKLMLWAREAAPPPPAAAPLGFGNRVASQWLSAPPLDVLAIWQRAVWKMAWAAMALIVLGLMMLAAQRSATGSPYDVSPAIQIVSTELVP